MQPARPLRDVFADLAGTEQHAEPSEVLRAGGHSDLPDALVSEAVGSYADTAPVEVAEHLSPYVMAHSPVPRPDGGDGADPEPGGWLDLVATAPVADTDPLDGLDDLPPTPGASSIVDRPELDHPEAISFGHGGAGHPAGPTVHGPADAAAGPDEPFDDIPTAPGIGPDGHAPAEAWIDVTDAEDGDDGPDWLDA